MQGSISTSRYRLGIAASVGTLFPLAAHADFSKTGGTGIGLTLIFPVALALFTVLAPPGRRLLVLGLSFIGLPLLAMTTYGFARGLPDDAASEQWFNSTAIAVAIALAMQFLARVLGLLGKTK